MKTIVSTEKFFELILGYENKEIVRLIDSLKEWEMRDSEFGISDSKFLIKIAQLHYH